jgi:hypothetical protein
MGKTLATGSPWAGGLNENQNERICTHGEMGHERLMIYRIRAISSKLSAHSVLYNLKDEARYFVFTNEAVHSFDHNALRYGL